MTLDHVVVGGGIHGVHLAARLLATGRQDLRILDPGPELLHAWHRCTGNTGMRFLRSPAVHHLDVDPWSLLDFAGRGRSRKKAKGLFTPPYERPAVGLFADHCNHVIERHGLAHLHLRDRAVRIDLVDNGATVHLAGGDTLRARRIYLATGAADRPRWPDWAASLRETGTVRHVFEPGFVLEPDAMPARVAVIGGGISAAQVALRLADDQRVVHLVARHQPRTHQFDSDPGWVGPKYMRKFSRTPDLDQRRRWIDDARHAGSMPPDVHKALRRAVRRGSVQWHLGRVSEADASGHIELLLEDERLQVDAVLLATGFDARRPGGALVEDLIERHDLPCAKCGFPKVDRNLRWHTNLFVSGALAELEIGPVSRNIAGARRAAERIVPLM